MNAPGHHRSIRGWKVNGRGCESHDRAGIVSFGGRERTLSADGVRELSGSEAAYGHFGCSTCLSFRLETVSKSQEPSTKDTRH